MEVQPHILVLLQGPKLLDFFCDHFGSPSTLRHAVNVELKLKYYFKIIRVIVLPYSVLSYKFEKTCGYSVRNG